jgi:hypothetical protein
MKTGLRDYDDMNQRLEELEPADGLNQLLLQHAASGKDEVGVVELLQGAFAQYVVEADLPSHKMVELNAKMTNYIEAIVEDPELTEDACIYWLVLYRQLDCDLSNLGDPPLLW